MHAEYVRYSFARKLAERCQKAWPSKGQFVPLQSPNSFRWSVGLVKENTILAYADKPKGPLPGEPGYVEVKKHKFLVEYTDLFCGEANYSWVKRATIEVPETADERRIMRVAKAEVGLTGVKGRTWWYGDEAKFRPTGMLTVLFVTFDDS